MKIQQNDQREIQATVKGKPVEVVTMGNVINEELKKPEKQDYKSLSLKTE